MDVSGESVLVRARAARRESAQLCGWSRELGGTAARLGDDGRELGVVRRRGASRRLEWETAVVDDGVLSWTVMRRFVEFDSGVVGRDLVIEDAKTLLCDRFGVGRGAAFAMLRRLSSQRNLKLRDVARGLVGASHVA